MNDDIPTCGKPVQALDVKRIEGPDVESSSAMVTLSVPNGFHGRVEFSFVCIRPPNHDGDCSCAMVKYKPLVELARSLDSTNE